jgi:quercetin dioxygenase-like cupin family protein
MSTTSDAHFAALLEGLSRAPGALPSVRQPVQQRLRLRVAEALAASGDLITLRRHQMATSTPRAGVSTRTLFFSGHMLARHGQARQLRLIELAPGARWTPFGGAGTDVDSLASAVNRHEWLVLKGQLDVNGHRLSAHDFHVDAARATTQLQASPAGALVYLRESTAAQPPQRPYTQHERASRWQAFAPGIQRRLMWSAHDEAAMLYRAQPGASVPRHAHDHDEECLMLEGELFLDDVLLRAGEFQLAPAGTGHGGVYTDVGALLYAHGDLALALRPD